MKPKFSRLLPALITIAPPLLTAQTPSPDAFKSLDALVVTGSAMFEPLKDAPVRTEIINREVIEKSAARDLAQIVEYSPGLRVDTGCSNCNTQSIQLLGLPQSYIAILQDGLPTFSGLAGVYGIEQIPAGLIGQVEVVKGGGSALYGPNAVAGVINLIPRDPTKNGGIFETRVAGSWGHHAKDRPNTGAFGLYDWVLPEQNLKITAFGDTSYVQPIDVDGDGFTDVSERELFSGGVRTVWTPSNATKISFDFFRSREDRRGGDAGAAFDGPPNLAVIAEEIFSTRNIATLKWEQEITENLKSKISYAYSGTSRDSYYGGMVSLGSPDLTSPYYDPANLFDPLKGFGETQDDLHFIDALFVQELSDKHQFSYGAQFRTESLSDTQPAISRTIDADYEDLGILAQHRWKISEIVTAEYGARVDFHSNVNDPIISPRANLFLTPSDSFRIRNSLGWGFRAPEVFNEDLHISNVGGDLLATTLDPKLKEESSVTLSVAPEWQINDNWRLEVNGFHTRLNGTFVDVSNDDPTTTNVKEFLKTNGEDSAISGAEINLGYAQDNWRVEASWTEQRLDFDKAQSLLGGSGGVNDNEIFSNSYARTPNSLGLLKFFHEGDWVESFVALKLTGPMDVPFIVTDNSGALVGNRLNRSPWFFNVDVGLSKKFEIRNNQTLTASLGVKNLLNQFQKDISQGAYRDAGYIYGPAFPRSVYAGLKLEF